MSGSALVYREQARAVAESDPVGPGSPYGLSKLAQEMTGAHAAARTGAAGGVDAVVQPHRPAAGSVVLHVERGPPDRAHRARPRRTGPRGRQPGGTARSHRRPRHRSGVRGDRGAGRPRPRSTTCAAARPIGSATSSTRCCRARACAIAVRQDPARYRPHDAPLVLGDRSRLTSELGWVPRIPIEQTLSDLLEHWRKAVRAGGAVSDTGS